MGNLPASRVTPSAPFTSTGVDYAGPFNLLASVARGQRITKHYVAVFICLATKAINLECVDDYSTAGFLAAFRCFVSRRGLPTHVYSDNGTNFQGADRELSAALRALMRDASVQESLANDGIIWHFIPPAAPHFGGLWEAGVKSLKYHLKRAVGTHSLSRAEFATLLCQVEACLNSRPISALSADPTDLAALTPGHFLIGRLLVCAPEPSVTDEKVNRLSRWQLVSRMQEQIWRRWSHDYLHSLQQRHKWPEAKINLQENDLVLLKNNLLPPTKWDLARVTEVHPGRDGLTRENPGNSVRRVARALDLSRCTVHHVLRRNGLHPYHYQRVQDLYPGDEEHRIYFCEESCA
ncbi:PREDICTED: uncharacterized protein LOC105449730 [Wasmannia auropunctata]|uniref:uncharacterized protein LOC105449730 n=1 Tax=Wasmannia auropunctata TaxID=64793 RepID=UPI0005F0A6BC|nr:PREDICTED: uncharacterized protein LOC105449730 [Wasmannia auropunctata]